MNKYEYTEEAAQGVRDLGITRAKLRRVRDALRKHREQIALGKYECGGDGCPGCYTCWSDGPNDGAERVKATLSSAEGGSNG